MISVCIPVYNCDVRELVEELLSQLKNNKVNGEIIVVDDASNDNYKAVNKKLLDLEYAIYIELEKNIGRSAIRNLFLKYAQFDNLLFLDCDTKILNDNFITNYLNLREDVICGGRIYSQKPGERKYLLRWKYGINRECKLAKKRALEPYHSFMTNNFVVKISVLQQLQFDERLTGYGHEDSIFGYHLMKNNYLIKHIDNQTIHDFNETSEEFLKKTQQGIENLLFIHTCLLPNGEFIEFNKLLKTFEKTKRIRSLLSLLSYPLLPFFAVLFRVGIVLLWCFDAYKLLYLCKISKTKTSHLV